MPETFRITPEIVAEHGLTVREYDEILRTLGREPTPAELGVFSVMWSEHCSYKHTRPLLATLPTKGPGVLHGPGENAGVIDLGDGIACAFKIESHNHPSAVEPFQGAATGVGGILRDIFAMGAFPIAVLDSLRFGPMEDPKSRRIAEGVIGGISEYGNCVGVPTVGGEFATDPCYSENCLVNVMCVGLARHGELMTSRATGAGNLLVYYGNATGRDGVHGATFASTDLTGETAESRSCIQVGDPFMEKKILEATRDLIASGALIALQDMGAAGLVCSSTEMAHKGGLGLEMDLDAVPQRAAKLSAYEILLSESQERMLAVVAPESLDRVRAVLARWDLDACVVGRTTQGGRFVVRHHGETEVDVPLAPICSGAPRPDPVTPVPSPAASVPWDSIDFAAWSWNEVLLEALRSPNFASKRWIHEQYDHQVQSRTVVRPGAGAAVVRVSGAGLHIPAESGGGRALALTSDGNGLWCALDPFEGTKRVVAEAAANLVAAGARPLAVTNNLNFGNPRTGRVAWQLAESIRGLGEACRVLGTPVTGGNVSLYNESPSGPIFPTPVIGMVGIMDDAAKAVRAAFVREGSAIVHVGPRPTHAGGSRILRDRTGSIPGPHVACDLDEVARVHALMADLIHAGCIASATDVGEGGLLIALSELALASSADLGFRVKLPDGARPEVELLSEEASRFVVECPEDRLPDFLASCSAAGVPARVLGRVAAGIAEIAHHVSLPLASLRVAWDHHAAAAPKAAATRAGFTAADYAAREPEGCGVVAVANHPDAAKLVMLGLYALQHRGQESAGICAWDGREARLVKDVGRVSEIFGERVLAGLPGSSAVGHVRYSTTGSNSACNAQPLLANVRRRQLAVAHNGNLTNADALSARLEENGAIYQSTTDSELLLHLIAQDPAVEFHDAVRNSLGRMEGAFSIAMLANDEVWVAKDPRGIRPLCLGKLGNAWIVASETCALDIVGATFLRELAPGEVLRFAGGEVHRQQPLAEAPQAFCVFELIYYSRPDSLAGNRSIYHYRLRLGAELAREHPADCDVVIPIPDSSTPAGVGYARELGVPLEMGLIRSHYIGRTFIQPAQEIRDFAARIKYNPVHSAIAGRRVVLVDDSIVRGTTSTRIVRMVRDAGAREVHFRVSAPPWKHSCYYGIDTPNEEELLANRMTPDGIREYLGVDSIGFISLEGVLRAVPPTTRYCHACFSGQYEAGRIERRTKHMARG